ncbi:Tryptase beta-2 [Mactra antiquata]
MIKLTILALVGTVLAQGPLPSSVPCGVPTVQPITNRIVGGQTATPGSWPWATLLADSLGFISGTGAIINPHVILTSAQHFEGPGYSVFDLDIKYWRIYAGEYNISMDDPHEKFYHINRVILHPGYNITSLENDIALIITREPIQYNDHTRAACLPDATHTYTVGETCYLPGWGSTSSTGNEEVMNQVDLPIVDDSICANHWNDFLPATELCAGYENGGKDFCGDDIGSPLMCKDQSGAWYIQGIASSGGDCTKADEPGIFEDVSQYSDWIKQTMEQAGYSYEY